MEVLKVVPKDNVVFLNKIEAYDPIVRAITLLAHELGDELTAADVRTKLLGGKGHVKFLIAQCVHAGTLRQQALKENTFCITPQGSALVRLILQQKTTEPIRG